MGNELSVVDSFCVVDKTSISFKRDVTKDEWQKVFDACRHIEGCVQFWIGDLLKYREQKWGMYNDVIEDSGYEKGTLKVIKSVCENVKPLIRINTLSFAHHQQVAPLVPEQQKEWLNKASENKWSVRELKDEIRKDSRKSLITPDLPEGVFDVIYADPPWEYSNSGFQMSAENQYPTMDTESICSMDIPLTAENAVLFLWVTNPLLEDGIKVISSWGFEYKTNIVWIKKRHTAGFYVFGQHELLLICVKGSMLPEDSGKIHSIIEGDNDKHSKKPEIVYGIIEKMYPGKKYVELFARNKREGWESYGNEL